VSDNPHRLPRTIVPQRYDITLEPDLGAATFAGECVTEVEVVEPTNTLVCNAAELVVQEAWVELMGGGERIDPESITLDPHTERLTLAFTPELAAGEYRFHTRFDGVLNDKLCGFYRSTFTDTEGNEQVLATTQMEATDCRKAFPCWDEPDRKAIFGVTLVVPEDLLALSNAGEVRRSPAVAGKVSVEFADTMVMSTYLVAFVVGPLEITDAMDVDGVPLRVAYPKGRGHLSGFALEIGAFALRHFTDYYGIPYPGDKLDLVAIPDFAFGAMENLGCVTFRETALLVDPEAVPQAELQRVTDVVAHELAHMWFGDLVTMKWWNGIWLNEAFATFMEMHATNAFRPQWNRWTDFGLSRTAAFDVDALATTRPIEYEVVSPADAEGMFDILTYEKGAAVVRMLEQYLGEDVFRLGIRRYLATHAYGNTDTDDLWEAIEAESGEPVREIMAGWIFQGGFPVIDVDLVRDDITASEGETMVRLTQQRFHYAGGPAVEPSSWTVPVLVTLCQRPEHHGEPVITVERLLLDADGTELPVLGQLDWVVVNTEGTGFYRTNYSPELLEVLATHAMGELSPIERYGLIDDAAAAMLADHRSAPELLHFIEGFAAETDLSVWQRLIGALAQLDRLVDGDARSALAERIGALVRPALARLGHAPVEGEPDRTRELRGVLLHALATLGNDPVAQLHCRDLFSAGAATDPSLLAAATWVVATIGDATDFDEYLHRYRTASSPQEEVRYLQALADFDHAELIDRVCVMAISDDVRTQNAPYLLRRCLTNRSHGPRAWAFVVDNWDTINARLPSNSISRMLEGIRSLHQPEVADRVFEFFTTHEVPQGDKIVAQHIERLQVNVALRARQAHHLAAALR